jgi:hypothetical protein
MLLNSYVHQQLGASHRGDLLEAAGRDRLAGQARARDRDLLRRRAPRREGVRPHPVASLPRGSAPRTAMR